VDAAAVGVRPGAPALGAVGVERHEISRVAGEDETAVRQGDGAGLRGAVRARIESVEPPLPFDLVGNRGVRIVSPPLERVSELGWATPSGTVCSGQCSPVEFRPYRVARDSPRSRRSQPLQCRRPGVFGADCVPSRIARRRHVNRLSSSRRSHSKGTSFAFFATSLRADMPSTGTGYPIRRQSNRVRRTGCIRTESDRYPSCRPNARSLISLGARSFDCETGDRRRRYSSARLERRVTCWAVR